MKLYINKEEYQKELSSQKEMSLTDTMREVLGIVDTSEIAVSKEEKITKTTDDVINFILGENKLK
jgi:hypothetical protein|tara:strand:+ start:490 stop:684 length:195 start_codon:yes stop_codon:yes gene_type:complete